MRSKWKHVPVKRFIYRKSFLKKIKNNFFVKFYNKGIKVFFYLLNKRISVYNGVKFIFLMIKKQMVGKYLGEFLLTKRITSDIHINKKNKRRKK